MPRPRVLVPLLSAAALLVFVAQVFSVTDVAIWHNDQARTGANTTEAILNPTNVNSTQFGKVFSIPVDGKVDAQPLIVSNVNLSGTPGGATRNLVFIATEHDSVYACDADDGSIIWQKSLLKAGEIPSDNRGCGQATPEIGITATPVIGFANVQGVIYVVAMSKDAAGNYFQRLHALGLPTGAEVLGGPVDIVATYPGTGDNSSGGTVVFDPKQYKARAGLVLSNNVIYTTWASHCDIRPYTSWVIGYNANTLARVSVLNLTPNGTHGAIWASGAAPAVDESGNLFALTGDGTFETTLNGAGFPTMSDFGNCMVKLATSGNTLAVADYFTMFNTVSESNADGDLGSGGTLLLPDMIDASGSTRHLAVGAGKDAHIYLVDRDNMGKFVPNATSNSYVYQDVSNSVLGSGVWSAPAFFNNRLYYGAVNERLRAFPFANARIALAAQSQTATSFTYPGITPSISAFGLSEGIAWAAENTNPAVLHAYDAGNLATELYNSNQAANSRDHFGTGNKFIVPTVANGKVYVASTNSVAVFGLFTPPRLANISTRANVMTGENVLIGGFLLHGAGQRQLLIRAIGPSLAVNGTPLTGRLQDPTIEVIRNSAIIAMNDNWGDSPQKDQIIATGIAPTEPNEAAVLITLGPDAFTAIMRGANNTTGLGLIEVYDVSSSSTCKLVNLSSRGHAGPGDDVLIGGIILNGSGPTKVVVRAVGGSSLVSAGVTAPLADPVLELHDANGAVLAVNDNWQQSAEMQKIFDTGLAPPDPLDAAILASLPSANYTAIVRGKGSATGVALVEVYQLQ